MIEQISIERFKNLQSIEVPLDNINVLVGSNNAGKSSILQSIQFAVSIAQTTSLDEFKFSRWTNNRLSTSLTPNQIIYSPIRDVYSLGHGGYLGQNESSAIVIKFKERDTHDFANFTLRKGKNKNLRIEIEGKTLGTQMRSLDNPFSIYVPGLAGIPSYEELKSEGIIRRAAAKGDANNVFRNILWLLKQQLLKWTNFTNDFASIFPELKLNVSFDQSSDEHINATISDHNKSLPIDAFGTGVLQTIQILSYVHLYSPKILILDEPDSHLHPSNQRIIAEKLSEITNRLNFQIILSTHSRHLLDAFKDYASIKWISKGKINEQEYSFISVLLDIGALDKGDVINNGNTRCVVLTEDTLTAGLKTLLNANGFNMAQTDIWPYDGCSKIDTAVVLAAFIKKNAAGTTVVMHRDRDYLADNEIADIITKANTAGIEIFFTEGTDVEGYFLNPHHINKVYPEVPLNEIINLINEATLDNETKSLENFINSVTANALKLQYAGGEKVNNGQISTKCNAEYTANKERFRHGKKVLKSFRKRMQDLHSQKDLLIPTEDLKVEQLLEIKTKIWP